MKLSFQIIHLEEGARGHLYSVKIGDREMCEFERFLEWFADQPDTEKIARRIQIMLDDTGFQKESFRDESTYLNSVSALSNDLGNLRLYCCQFSTTLLIAGYGGIKHTKTYQDDPKLLDAVQTLEHIEKRIMSRHKAGGIKITTDGKFDGDLTFESEE